MNTKQKAFTLAETMIVLVILGIVATLTISTAIRKNQETVNRTKVKKAMALYDNVLSKIVVEYEIRGMDGLYSPDPDNRRAFAPQGNCSKSSQYFKAVENITEEDGSVNLCKFKAADGLWWDISNISKPLISLTKSDLINENSPKTFKLNAYFDNNGALRVSDLQYAVNNPNLSEEEKRDLQKLYAFINNKVFNENPENDKLLKPISNFEEVANIFMVENELNNINDLFKDNCKEISNYFNITSQNGCSFTTADGSYWVFNKSDGSITLYDDKNNLNSGIKMGVCPDGTVNCESMYPEAYNLINNAKVAQIEKNVTNFIDVAEAYMIEGELNNINGLFKDNCKEISNYFNITSQNGCRFSTADGSYWEFNQNDGSITVSDDRNFPKKKIKMGVCPDGTVNCEALYPEAYTLKHNK